MKNGAVGKLTAKIRTRRKMRGIALSGVVVVRKRERAEVIRSRGGGRIGETEWRTLAEML